MKRIREIRQRDEDGLGIEEQLVVALIDLWVPSTHGTKRSLGT